MYLKFKTKKNEKSVMRKRNAQLLTTIGHLTHAIGEQSKILILIFHIPHILKHIEIVDLRWVNTK